MHPWDKNLHLEPLLKVSFVPIFTHGELVPSRDILLHTTNCHKHRDRGDGAACHSSNKDLINPHDPTRGQPGGRVGRGNRLKKYGSNTLIKVDINFFPSMSVL